MKFSSSVNAGTTLWSVTGSELNVLRLKIYHSASSKGPFIAVSSNGMILVSQSEITSESTGYVFWKEKIYIYIIYLFSMMIFFFFLFLLCMYMYI
jgi:hypothetical protein